MYAQHFPKLLTSDSRYHCFVLCLLAPADFICIMCQARWSSLLTANVSFTSWRWTHACRWSIRSLSVLLALTLFTRWYALPKVTNRVDEITEIYIVNCWLIRYQQYVLCVNIGLNMNFKWTLLWMWYLQYHLELY